jgi:hypothetical protein
MTDDERKQRQREYMREYYARPEVKERAKARRDRPEAKERQREYWREYYARPEVKERVKLYRARPDVKERQRDLDSRPEAKAKRRARRARPEAKERRREYERRPEVVERRRARVQAQRARATASSRPAPGALVVMARALYRRAARLLHALRQTESGRDELPVMPAPQPESKRR